MLKKSSKVLMSYMVTSLNSPEKRLSEDSEREEPMCWSPQMLQPEELIFQM